MIYKNVLKDRAAMQELLSLSGGRRDVPLIVEEGRTTIGHGGS